MREDMPESRVKIPDSRTDLPPILRAVFLRSSRHDKRDLFDRLPREEGDRSLPFVEF
jgi:hypothetical protein